MWMRDYRAYIIASDGRITDRFEFWANDDEDAKLYARKLMDGRDIELWHQAEKIAELKSET
jgi:hypothetical protein